jgi:type I restriction enzyme R subunit
VSGETSETSAIDDERNAEVERMSLHKEVEFESEICAELSARGWLYEANDAVRYSREFALFPQDLIDWVRTSQPGAWESLQKTHGVTAETGLIDRVRSQLDSRGTLDVLRHGVDVVGLKGAVALAQFRPALRMNPDLQSRYIANRLRVVRQVRYSLLLRPRISLDT